MADLDPEIETEAVGLLDTLVVCEGWQLGRCVTVDLRAVEDGVSAGEDPMTAHLLIIFFIAPVLIIVTIDLPENDRRSAFTSTYLSAFGIPLLIRSPDP